MSALGPGGHGYFALDITNIKSPKHLFAIENDPFDNVVRIWNGQEQKSEYSYSPGTPMADEEFDYQKLGEAWSAPRIIRIKHNGNDKWVASPHMLSTSANIAFPLSQILAVGLGS